MTVLSRFIALMIAAMLVFGPASAKDTSQETRVALIDRVAAFDAAMRAKDMKTVVAMIPQKVFAALAARNEMSTDELSAQIVKSMAQVFDKVEIVDFELQTDAFELAETETGIAYTFLPTTTVIVVDGTKIESRSQTLALRDDDEWFLMRVDNLAQVKVLRDVYPGFANIEFGKGTTKIID